MIKVLCFILSVVVLALVGCGQADHPPRKGEYGQKLLTSIQVDQELIDELNSDRLPKPFLKQDHEQLLFINFMVEQKNNPYRFVIVARGKTQREGEVDVRFMGGVMSSTDGMSPEIFREEDTHEYDANESVLLILPSDPFSLNVNSEDSDYAVQAGLSRQENFIFEEVELQIWEGKGGKYSMLAYLGFFAIIASALLGVYRLVAGLEH